MIQSDVIEMDYLTINSFIVKKKTSFLKLNEHEEISIISMKNYLDENFVEQLRSTKFTDYSNYTCLSGHC